MKNLKLVMMMLAVAAMTACGDKGTEEPKNEVKDGTYVGKLVVDQNDGTNYDQENVNVELTFNEDGTANIKMVEVKFADNMPIKLDMTIPGMTAAKTSAGYSLSGNNIIPLAGNGEFPAYTIKNLTGSVTAENISLDMMCGVFPLIFSGTAKTE